jgi:hypothetical protein
MKKILVIVFVMVMLAIACGTQKANDTENLYQPPDEGQPAFEVTDTLPPPPPPEVQASPMSQKRCGDGVCDGPETAENCPQDCGEESGPPVVAPPQQTGGTPDYEPPINIFLVLHIDPVMDQAKETFKVTPEIYHRTKAEILWLKEEAERHNMQFTALFNGWYPKEALELGDLDQFQGLLEAGHEIGTHAHRLTYDEEKDLWISWVDELSKLDPKVYDHDLARQTWFDAYFYVDAMLTEIGVTDQNETVCAVAFKLSDQGQLMEEFGFSIAAGQQGESAINFFGHIIWNPWRPTSSDDPGLSLTEDLNTNFIAVPHLAQIGIRGGVHGTDLSLEQIQRRFLMLYIEWLRRERTGAEDKVWSFGFVYHPEDGDVFNDTFADFLTWLDANFVGKTSPHGNIIAQYASIGEIADQYIIWEDQHPGTSSFSYKIDDPYPYSYEILPNLLGDAAFEREVDLVEEVTVYQFLQEGKAIYVLWSDKGEVTIDFSSELSGEVTTINSAGLQTVVNSSAITLSEEPLFIQLQE